MKNLPRLLNMSLWVLMPMLLTGCLSTGTYVAPTQQETYAVSQVKGNLALLYVSEEYSPLAGVADVMGSRLEKMLSTQFNVVDPHLAESFRGGYSDGMLSDMGRRLGVDYVAVADVAASVDRSSAEFKEEDNEIVTDYCGEAKVTLKIVAVDDGSVVFHETGQNQQCFTLDGYASVDPQKREEQLKEARRKIREGKRVDYYQSLPKMFKDRLDYGAMDIAMNLLKRELRQGFSQVGEIIGFQEDNQVVINLGSAYGVRPGDRFIVYDTQDAFYDPLTGTQAQTRTRKAILRVMHVTSGLSSIAVTSSRELPLLRRGDQVHYYR